MGENGGLRIVAWNANGGVHDKLSYLRALAPDVAIICECADETTLRRKAGPAMDGVSMTWVGRLPHKGLAVLGFGPYEVTLDSCFDESLEWVAPVRVDGPVQFNLLSVWAANHRASQFTGENDPAYMPQPRSALTKHRDFIESAPTVMAGDFNDGVYWDAKPRRWVFQDFIDQAAAAGLVSAYHHLNPGSPEQHTLFWKTRTPDAGYHIDYVFVPARWLAGLRCEIGLYDDWIATTPTRRSLSDHAPVTVDVAPAGR